MGSNPIEGIMKRYSPDISHGPSDVPIMVEDKEGEYIKIEKVIPEEWIKNYVDQILSVCKIDPDSPMSQKFAERADHILDMVKAYRDSKK